MKHVIIIIISLAFINCSSQKNLAFKPKKIYHSKNVVIHQITQNTFQHISYLQTNDFGNVPCNGLIIRDNKEVIIFDTPSTDKGSEDLIKFIQDKLHCRIIAIVPTHFHNDCLGGLNEFEKNGVPSYANAKTIELAKQNKFSVPENSFNDSTQLNLGNEIVAVKFFGEGHTKDNVVAYFEKEQVLFGGCLIKELNASKGYLGDANVAQWPATVEKIKAAYPNVQIVVPGHGAYGNRELLDYTINLFKQ